MKQIDEIRPSLLNDWQERSEELVPEGGTGNWWKYGAMLPDEPTRSLLNEPPSPPRLVLLAGGKKENRDDQL
jgi:hypothetical protein